MSYKEMYCDYRKHTYKIGDLIYLDQSSENGYNEYGEYGRIIQFHELDNCKMVTYEVIIDSEGSKPLLHSTSTAYLGNIQPAKEVIECKINELQHQIDLFKELLKNE